MRRDGDDVALGTQVVELETAGLTVSLFPTRFHTPDDARMELGFVETATPDHPARVRATMRNEDEYENVFRARDMAPFAPSTSADLDGQPSQTSWYLVPTADSGLVDETPANERGPDGYWRLAEKPRQWLPDRRRLDAGESVSGEFLLLGHPENSDHPPDVYRITKGRTALSLAVWRTSRPGPAGESLFEGQSPPPLHHCDSTRWYHEATPESPVYVEPTVERTELPARIDFTLVNHSHSHLEGSPDPDLYKLSGGTWFHVPTRGRAVLQSLPPGSEKSYALRAFPDEIVPCDRGYDYGHLGAGTYALSTFRAAGDPVAALVRFDGPSLELEPEENVDIERDGATVTVTDAHHRQADEPHSVTLLLERTDSATETFIAEQLTRGSRRGLRNCLPFFDESVERVVLHSDRNASRGLLPGRDETIRFTYEDQAYVVRRHGN